jgi:acetyl-CoA/propionyl-CoA carboxylase biotin carboxyl carrier protein
VVLPADLAIKNSKSANPTKAPRRAGKKTAAGASGDAVTSPMQGTIVKVAVEEGQQVNQGDLVVVLEAMKMEQPLTAHKSGKVSGLVAQIGTTVPSGTVLLEITD